MIISLEGIPGAGKTTVLNLLARSLNISIVSEDIGAWASLTQPIPGTTDDASLFDLYYTDKNRWSFAFQVMALATGIQTTLKAHAKIPCVMSERSISTNKLFAENRYETGKMSLIEWNIYKYMHATMTAQSNLHPTFSIYLRVSPTVAFERVTKRNRNGEQLTLHDLEILHEKHDIWSHKSNVITVDASALTPAATAAEILTILAVKFPKK